MARSFFPQAAKKLGLEFRVGSGGPRRLAEEIDSQGGFAEVFQAVRAAPHDVLSKIGARAAGEGTEE